MSLKLATAIVRCGSILSKKDFEQHRFKNENKRAISSLYCSRPDVTMTRSKSFGFGGII